VPPAGTSAVGRARRRPADRRDVTTAGNTTSHGIPADDLLHDPPALTANGRDLRHQKRTRGRPAAVGQRQISLKGSGDMAV
jgi:hypothetical protein